MKYLIYIPLILFIIVSCKKKQTIKVRVINPVTGEGYANLDVQIEACKSGAFEDRCKVVYSGATNENGIALIETRLNTSWRHTLYVDLPDDYCYSNGISEPIFDNESDNHEFTFERAPCAEIRFRYYNQNCLNSSDRIEATRYNGIEDYVGFQNPAVYEGCTDYTSSYASVPMGWWYFEWKVIKNGQTENFTDSIYLEAGQQFQYDFIY